MNSSTDKMFNLLNETFQKKSGKPIMYSQLGQSTKHFNFFLTQSISQTLSITSSLSSGAANSQSLVNRLIQLSSQGKFSQIDTYVKKLTSKITTKSQDNKANLEVISENCCKDEEGDDEEVKELDLEVEKALKQAAAEEEKGEIEVEVEVKFENTLMINKKCSSTYKEYEAVCHSFFIVKDNTEINWRRPYVQQSSVQCKVTISSTAFAEGAMRYAFLAFDKTYSEGYVAKLPKKISEKTYNL